MTTLICCWTRKRRSRNKGTKGNHGDQGVKNEMAVSLEQTKVSLQSLNPGDPHHTVPNPAPPQPPGDRYSNIPESLPKGDGEYDSLAKKEQGDTGYYDNLAPKEQEEDSGYAVLDDPSKPEEGTGGEGVKSDDEYDYALPYFEPSSKEEELVVQISDLKVPTISSSSVKLLDPLGSGQFGLVHKGVWVHKKDGREVSTEVAVKTMRDGASEEDKIKFFQEAAIMGQFRQPNILGIRGIIMEGDTLRLVMDLMDKGDLRSYLASLRQSVETKEMASCMLKQLLVSFTRQIALGVGYLSMRSYVHRDLAARNILVSDEGTCKIADFGLSRDLHQENYYKSHGGKIPVKWTAPEGILYRKYSQASDIWSYGCVLYEIWSLGEKPFSGHTNTETIKAVSTGYRLPPPPGCPKPIYNIMIDCWHPDPESRPLVCAIVTQLQRPDFLLLQWSEGETSQYSEEARTLGTALENGHCLHVELQRRYLKEGGPTVERSEQ